MPIQYKAGTPANRNFDPKGRKGAADAKGVYQTSVFYAPLCFLDVDTYTVDPDVYKDNVGVQLLLFTSDLPALCRVDVHDETTNQTNSQACSNSLTLNNLFVTDTAGGGSAVLASNYGEVLTGFSGALQLVPVSGFACSAIVTPPLGATVTLGVVQPGNADSVTVACIANANSPLGVIGPVFYGKSSSPGGAAAAPAPIILKSGDYTAALRANKNLVTDAANRQYQIVGLWYGPGRA